MKWYVVLHNQEIWITKDRLKYQVNTQEIFVVQYQLEIKQS